MAQRQVLKARYQVKPLGKVKVLVNKTSFDKTKGLTQAPTVVEQEMFMVLFPQGHSIRVKHKELVRLGYHVKPRIVDMLTGDVVDIGGDLYDFSGDVETVDELIDDDDTNPLHDEKKKA